MVLINIDTLTDSELKYIAMQEQIDNSEEMTREELLSAISEIYDTDEQDNIASMSDGHKFVKGITDFGSDFLQLPGVEMLPEMYNETSIHMVRRDSHWAYAFWSISSIKENELIESDSDIKIRLVSGNNSYDIDVDIKDNNWNVELPWGGGVYSLKLIATTNGEEEILAVSSGLVVNEVYLKEHSEEIEDSNSYKILISSMTSRDKELINVDEVRNIINMSNGEKE